MIQDLQLLLLLTRYFSPKINSFSSKMGKMVVSWIFIQKTSDLVKFSLIEKTVAKQKEKRVN